MTHPTVPILRSCAVSIALTGVSVAVLAADWRQAHVHAVTRRSEVDPGVNLDCAPVREARPDQKVLVVSYRVGKSRRWRAFDAPADDSFAVGDEVVVDLAECRVVRVLEPSDASAPAP
jgi:hypothetical protein